MTEALSGGVRFFQYRCKKGARGRIYETALALARMAHQANALFIVNDHADIAVAVDADGVHLGQDDLPIEYARKLLGKKNIIGISTHSFEQAKRAEAAGADYIGFGPLFPTSTKDAGEARGPQKLGAIRQSVTIPVIAIGGINHTNVQEALQAGADGVAVISAVLSAENIRLAAGDMIRLLSEVRRNL